MIAFGIFCGIVLLAIAVLGFFEYQHTEYECANCGHRYKPKIWNWIINMPVYEWRELRCPKCKDKNWHRRNLLD